MFKGTCSDSSTSLLYWRFHCFFITVNIKLCAHFGHDLFFLELSLQGHTFFQCEKQSNMTYIFNHFLC